jgi:hypothetical protein
LIIGIHIGSSRRVSKSSKIRDAIKAINTTNDNGTTKSSRGPHGRKRKKKAKQPTEEEDSDLNDEDFSDPEGSGSESDDSDSDIEITRR